MDAKLGTENPKQSLTRWALCVFVTLTVGCGSIGPKRLVSSHESYNDAVQLTVTREVLKNVVRRRYVDPIQFIAVDSINSSFSVTAGLSTAGAGIGTDSSAGQVGATVGYSDSPTITFVPQSDAGFYNALRMPIAIGESLELALYFNTLEPEYISFAIGAINDSYAKAGAAGELYRQRVNALVRLDKRGAVLQQVREYNLRPVAVSRNLVTGEDHVLAAKDGFLFVEDKNGETLHIASHRIIPVLKVLTPEDPEVVDSLIALGVEPGRQTYPIRPPSQASPLGLDPNTIWIVPRSVKEMMDLVSLHIDLPPQHVESGVVSLESLRIENAFDLPIHIRYATTMPPSIYRVQHRGYWFYIDDADTKSKQFLSLLVFAYSSRIGSRSATSSAPQLVLPIGTR